MIEREQTRLARSESELLVNEGYALVPTPQHKYKATVADVQEAFERADTRVARGAAQSPRSDNHEGVVKQSAQLRGGGDVSGDQVLKVVGRVAHLTSGPGCNDEVRLVVCVCGGGGGTVQ